MSSFRFHLTSGLSVGRKKGISKCSDACFIDAAPVQRYVRNSKKVCRAREHFSGAKVFDNIANLGHLGKLPADDELVCITVCVGVPASVGLCLVREEPN
jgi:hypothetical protein